MLVSAISVDNQVYTNSKAIPYHANPTEESNSDTTSNSLTSFRKAVPQEKLSQVFNNINEWKDFCHSQILGNKLNIIA